MNCEKISINSIAEHITDIKEQIIESDILLPEYYPEISKILKIDVLPEEEAVTVTEGKFSLAGCVKIRLLYVSEENRLCVFDNEQKYSKVITDNEIISDTCIVVRQTVNSVNYKATGPKKVDVKVNLSVSGKCFNIAEDELISSLSEDCECICIPETVCEPVCCHKSVIELDEKVQDLVFNDNNIKIIKTEGEISITETKTIKNKIMIKGTCKIRSIYCGDEKGVNNYDYTFPFTDVTEAFGVDENCNADILLTDKNISFSINQNESSNYSADINVKIGLLIKAYCKKEINLITDCYSVLNDMSADYKKIDLTEDTKTDELILEHTFDCEIYEENITKILCASFDNINISGVYTDEVTNITGTTELNALYADDMGNIYSLNRKVSFEYETEYCSEILYSCMHQAVTANILNGKTIRFEGKIVLIAEEKKSRTVNSLACVELQKDTLYEADNEKIILYFAQKGESLWNIAKNTRTSMRNIKSNNDISDDDIQEDRILILSDY